ncbi:MAG: hypothetical protein IPL24_03760 [Bacteroidetes bacterium]|nr:hypothetical protein [Bacteroidota bacterium]
MSNGWIIFETGEIMLSCFNNFRNYPDEMIGDKEEGHAIIGANDGDGNLNAIIYESGMDAYIMSATNVITEKVVSDFKATCALKINHPTLFGLELSKKIPFVSSGLEGNCNYSESRIKFLDNQLSQNRRFSSIDWKNDPNAKVYLSQITMGIEIFLKLEKYKHQQEYRMVWFSNRAIKESIIIQCPEAIEYCERLIF